jgi:hypothetical protein
MKACAVRSASADELARRQAELARFERSFTYPLGADRFRIDHGADYLAFFRGLGTPAVWVAEAGGELVGMLVAVRRPLPGTPWYLCDLKVARGHAGAGPRLLAAFDAWPHAAEPAYGISMDPARGANRLVEAVRRRSRSGLRVGPKLALWSFDAGAWQRVAGEFARALGPVGFRDLRGVKDIVLASTGQPMPLLHVQHGPAGNADAVGPRPGHVHMVCLPAAHPLTGRLDGMGLRTNAGATILCRGLEKFDWTAVLTSEI